MSAGVTTRIGTARVRRRGTPGYEEARRAAVWNGRKPDRYPDLIVTVGSEEDVVEAVEFARSRGLKVAVRAGGHSMSASPLRDGGMLIDLSELRGLWIDAGSRTASLEPAVTAGRLSTELARHDLAFPVGHSGSVPISGYLLAGGLGWNMGAWGPACLGLRSVRLVTARGELVTADADRNPDVLWAARGAGPGFFGVATGFDVALHDLPRPIRMSAHLYPLAEVEAVSRWATEIADTAPPTLELHLGLVSAPPGAPAGPAGKAVQVLGVAFARTEEEAAGSLALLETCPAIDRALWRQSNVPATFETLQEQVDATLPEGHRYAEHSAWSNEPLSALLPRLAEHMVGAPSPRSYVLAAALPPRPEEAPQPDAAFSMAGRTFLLCYAIWEDEAQDAANEGWFRQLVGSIEPVTIGHYVAETDLRDGPGRAARSFAPAAWERLQALRREHDPDDLFHSYLGST
jgi:FAD/FMN-containing dehydrogenase